MPQTTGSRRVVPRSPTRHEMEHLTELLQQETFWVVRARWPRWLRDGDPDDTIPISSMSRDSRLAAHAWLCQQRHVLHASVTDDDSLRAPLGWAKALPLARALRRAGGRG